MVRRGGVSVAKQWKNNWKNYWDSKDHWQYHEDEVDYGWLKRSVVATLLFAVIYGAHITDTFISSMVDSAVRYTLTTQTDFVYIIDKLASYAPKDVDMSVLKRVQSVVSKPADPLAYMNKPVNGKILAPFGWYTHPVLKQEMMHEGIDIEAPLGTSVRAAASGNVKSVADSARNGKTVIVEHGQDLETVYGHLGEILVKQGDAVSQGQVIAKSGKTGITTGPMLYFEVREKGKAIDPMTRVRGEFPAGGGK